MIRRTIMRALGVAVAAATLALTTPAAASPDTANEAGGADVTLTRFFGLISGAKGERRDRETLKGLFRPDAQFMYARRVSESEASAATLASPDSFIEVLVPIYERVGRRERPRWMHGDTKGDLAVIRVQYEWWDEGGKPIQGMKFVTLVRDGGAWKIAFMAWQDDAPGSDLADAAAAASRTVATQLPR